MKKHTNSDSAVEGETRKYVVLADGRVRTAGMYSIHRYLSCSCPMEDCGGRAVSAGFYSVEDGKVKVWGGSETLRLKSRPEDADLIPITPPETPSDV